jgi:TonB family protein
MAGSNLKRRIEDMKRTNKKSALTPKILLSLMAALAVFLCLAAGPFQEGIAQNAQSALKIENSGNSPLQIVSAAVADISLAPRITAQVAAQLVHPRIVVKNNSGQAVSVYVLEFRKPGSPALYFNRVDAGLAPKGTDIIEKNEFLWTAGEEVPGTGVAWAIRIDAVRFKDGNVVTLHGSPIPPPPGTWELSSAAPATKLRDPINVGIKLPESKLIKRVEPVYPELALKKRVQGRVILMINVDEEGNVTDAKVQDGSPVLNDAALAAVKQWKYSPTFLNGKPVPVIATVTVDFRLK